MLRKSVLLFVILKFIYAINNTKLNNEPKFLILNSHNVRISVPQYDGLKLILFRISIRDHHDFEFGENEIFQNIIIDDDKHLNIQTGDIINYLIGYRDNNGRYQAQVGGYKFNGDYHHGKLRKKRDLLIKEMSTENENNTDEIFIEPRFGGGLLHRLYNKLHNHDNYHHHHHHHHNHQQPQDFGSENYPNYDEFTPSDENPLNQQQNFPVTENSNCNPHLVEREKINEYEETIGRRIPTTKPVTETVPETTRRSTTTTTTTIVPDIDIRFADD